MRPVPDVDARGVPVTARYRLVVADGEYAADTLPRLVLEVLRHRTWHLLHGDGWVD